MIRLRLFTTATAAVTATLLLAGCGGGNGSGSEPNGKDAILKDNAEFVRALDAVIVAQDPRLPALECYTEEEGATAAQKWVQSFVDAGLTVTGTVRYYDRQVTVESRTTALASS